MRRALEKDLKSWKESKLRYPLLLRGARQVGKTYLIEKFGKEEFESFVSVNFEALPQATGCFESSLDPTEVLMKLEAVVKAPIKPGKTVLFLDEIQACPRAIVALRYFKERMPDLHVIGAGSLLEFALAKGKFSFPVGRVQFMYLKPLSFQEYALARGCNEELELLKECSLQNPPTVELHERMLQLVKEYFLIGGMPAAVDAFCESNSLQMCVNIHEILLATYRADFSKYATEAEQKYLRALLEGIPQTVGQQFKYSKIDPHIRARELKTALDQLESAGLIQRLFASAASGIPLSAQLKRNQFKLLFIDIGLIQHALQIDPQAIWKHDLIQVNAGAMAEQFVGQELLAYSNPHLLSQLFYWERDKQESSAEVDYVISIDRSIIPVEVKAGAQGKLRSLLQFMKEKKPPLGVRISQDRLSFQNQILSIPLYLVSELPRLARDSFSNF